MGNGDGFKMAMRKRIANMWWKLKMGDQMVKERTLILPEKSMLGNSRMELGMVKVHTLGLMGING